LCVGCGVLTDAHVELNRARRNTWQKIWAWRWWSPLGYGI